MEMFYIVLLVFFGLLFLVAELVLLPGVSIGAVLALVCYGSSVVVDARHSGRGVAGRRPGRDPLAPLPDGQGRDRRPHLRSQVAGGLCRPAARCRGRGIREFQRYRKNNQIS